MAEFDIVWPDTNRTDASAFTQFKSRLNLPEPYLSVSEEAKHLRNAIFYSALEFSLAHYTHVKNGHELRCLSYYSLAEKIEAYCAPVDDRYLVVVGVPFLRRLVRICRQAAPALERRRQRFVGREPLPFDQEFTKLLLERVKVSETETQDIIRAWPSASAELSDVDLGEYALFYDLVRLIWVHEWAHAICGHAAFAVGKLGLSQLNEFSTERLDRAQLKYESYPLSLILQNFELHADQFAVEYCVHQIVSGWDPAGPMSARATDLADRLVIFNTACAIFAIVWYAAEWYERKGEATEATHPPAQLRYMRFRTFQRRILVECSKSDPSLNFRVDMRSTLFLEILAEMCPLFGTLYNITPMLKDTEEMLALDAYESQLSAVAKSMYGRLDEMKYKAATNPYSAPLP